MSWLPKPEVMWTSEAMELNTDNNNHRLLERVLHPARIFAEHKLAGAGLLVAATVIALLWANSPWGDLYRSMLSMEFTVGFGQMSLSKPVQLWINDGLMGFFFFVVGLEIKREFLVGELSSLRHAMLPVSAAVGGMAVPALLYVAFNANGEGVHGWAIPMATDIAFCLGMLALVGDRAPPSLKVFLTALAIVDDIGAIVVIAIFYTDSILLVSLGLGAVILGISLVCSHLGVRSAVFYFILGTLTWLAFLKSGVHATLAAVLMAFTIPVRTDIVHRSFVEKTEKLLDCFREEESGPPLPDSPFLSAEQQHALDDLQEIIEKVLPPVQRLEHALVPVVTFLVLPAFALANAGVSLDPEVIGELGHPVAIGIITGLFVGKQAGIFGFTWLAVRLGIATLPSEMTMRHVYGGAVLGGIGFTMSLFIGGLAFDDPMLGELSKMSILLASILAAVWGWVVLCLPGSRTPRAKAA